MFRHGNDLYLIARTDPEGKFENSHFELEPKWLQHLIDLGAYSLRNHGDAIWKVNTEEEKLELVLDIPGCGDTAFPTIIRLSENEYLLANYSSPLKYC